MDLRRKDCPRFATEGPGGVVHRGCCAKEPCSDIDARGHVRCGWENGGKERLLAAIIEKDRSGEACARRLEAQLPAEPTRASTKFTLTLDTEDELWS